MTLGFNKMIAGFTFGENKHLEGKKALYFSHHAEMSEVWGQMQTIDFAIQNAIMYQNGNRPYFVQDETIKMYKNLLPLWLSWKIVESKRDPHFHLD